LKPEAKTGRSGLCFAKPGNWGINWWPLECLENNGLHFV